MNKRSSTRRVKSDLIDREMVVAAGNSVRDIRAKFKTNFEQYKQIRKMVADRIKKHDLDMRVLRNDLYNDKTLMADRYGKAVQQANALLKHPSVTLHVTPDMINNVKDLLDTYKKNIDFIDSISDSAMNSTFGINGLYNDIRKGVYKSAAKDLRYFTEWAADDSMFKPPVPVPDAQDTFNNLQEASRFLERILKTIKHFLNTDVLSTIQAYKDDSSAYLKSAVAILEEQMALVRRVEKGKAYIAQIAGDVMGSKEGLELRKDFGDLQYDVNNVTGVMTETVKELTNLSKES